MHVSVVAPLGLAALCTVAQAQVVSPDDPGRTFYAESVSYCSSSRAIEVDKFLLQYNVDQQTISFDISAASVEPDLRAIIEFDLDIYGIVPINTTLNLCTELGGLLCPLPVYNFVASTTLPIPGGIGNSIDIPSIGYWIPDLQAVGTVRLTRISDGSEAVCLRVALSNGKTTQLTGVSWAIGGIALGALVVSALSALAAGLLGDDARLNRGRRQERFLQIMSWFQFSALTGLLSLNYPNVVVAFTSNFGWALGLIRIQSFQDEIDDMRNRTGGNFTLAGGQLVGGTEALNRGFYVLPPSDTDLTSTTSHVATSLMTQLHSAYTHSSQFVKRQTTNAVDAAAAAAVVVPEVQDSDPLITVERGIPAYTAQLNISPYNAFLTVFFTFLLLLAIFVAVTLIVAVPLWLLSKRVERKTIGARSSRTILTDIVRACALRMLLIAWFPIALFSLFQWHLGRRDAWSPIVLAVFTFVPTTLALVAMWLLYARKLRRANRHPELTNGGGGPLAQGGGPYAPFWNPFRPQRWWFAALLLFASFTNAMFVALAQNHAWVQTVALTAVELIVFVAMCALLPFTNKEGNGLNITMAIVRIAIGVALILLNDSITLGTNQIPKAVVGFIIVVLEAVVSILLFIFLVIDVIALIVYVVKTRKQHRQRANAGDGGAPEMLEQRPHDYGVYGHQPPLAPPPPGQLHDGSGGYHYGGGSDGEEARPRSSVTLAESGESPASAAAAAAAGPSSPGSKAVNTDMNMNGRAEHATV